MFIFTGWTLRFVLGPSLHASPVRVFCNHPQDKHTEYDREKYHEVQWKNYTGSKIDRYDVVADVHIHIAGSFNYYFTVDQRSVHSIKMYITRISNYLLIIKLITVDIHSNGNFEIAQWMTQTRLKLDQISDVMFRMFTSSVVDRGFEPLSGKTKDYTNGIFA